ncbi:MAG: TolB family protein [Planctomycetota bacterium]
MAKRMILVAAFLFCWFGLSMVWGDELSKDERITQLAKEVRNKGWIAYAGRSQNGTWDIFLCRPDGTNKRNITNTSNFEEATPRFSPDGKKMLYRRLDKGTNVGGGGCAMGWLVMANGDGTNPVLFGAEREYKWASWSPDGKQLVCLTMKEVQVIDLATKKVVRSFPRQGIFSQIHWSPNGKWFCGRANYKGRWGIRQMNADTGESKSVPNSHGCTPDWFPNSKHIIYTKAIRVSSPPKPPTNVKGYGWAQLWMAEAEGTNQSLLYGENGFHIYGGALSPDAKYLLFTKHTVDGPGLNGALIYIMRFADAPTIHGKSTELRKAHPKAKDGVVLELHRGWEPSWTYAEIVAKK